MRPLLLAIVLLPGLASASAPTDLLAGRAVQGQGLSGAPSKVTAGVSRSEGEAGSPTNGAVLLGPGSFLVVDLGEPRSVAALLFQLDADDTYMIQGSADGETWTGLVRVQAGLRGSGLRARTAALPKPVVLRFLGVHAESGVGGFFVSRLSAYSSVPDFFPRVGPSAPAATSPDPDAALEPPKALLAAAGAALLTWGIALRRRGRPPAHARLRDASLLVLGVAGLAAFWNFGRFHMGGYVHTWDVFHYFVGAKYQPEVGYTHLYECAIAADAETRGAGPDELVLARNLETNTLERIAVGSAAGSCRPRFDEERWRAFTADVGWFREHVSPDQWQRMLQDHGYNATPAWGILGGLLARSGPATEARIAALTALDSALLVAMWALVVWAFGWRAAAVAALFWGTSYAGRFYWTGGAFLRMDWLFCLVAGVCFLKKRRPSTAGALLVCAALLRVFPALVLVALGASAIARRKRPDAFGLRFVAGGAAAAAVALALSLLAAGEARPGPSAWSEFAANAKKHLATPLTNNMGLTTLLSYKAETRAELLRDDAAVDPFERWKDERRRDAAAARPVGLAVAVLALAVLAWRLRDRPAWQIAAAAVGLVPFATDLTCYYHACLLVLALLAVEREEIGIAALAYAAVSCVVPLLLPWDEDRYLVLTALELALAGGAWVLLAARATRGVEAPRDHEMDAVSTARGRDVRTASRSRRSSARERERRPTAI